MSGTSFLSTCMAQCDLPGVMTDILFKVDMTEEEQKVAKKTLNSFLTMRAYDIISNGQYKKHVVHNKENCEAWAIELYAHYQKTLACMRNVSQIQSQIRSCGYDRLATLCSLVAECSEYPFTTNNSWSVCYLTGVRCKNSLLVKRNHLTFTSTKRAKLSTSVQMSAMQPANTVDTIDIHSKFRKFLVSYWMLSRFETVLKVIMRQWIQQSPLTDSTDYSMLCRHFSEDIPFQDDISNLFFSSWVHVYKSVAMLVSSKA
jgi:hypothetical protein